MKRIFLFTTLAISQYLAVGQTQDTARKPLFLQPVEVVAIRSGTNAPFTKTDLSKKDIEKINFGQDLPFLLNQVPSTVVNSDAGNGVGYTGIRIRGADLSRINVTVNGIPYNDAESQGVFFVDLPDISSSINSIQVQRGVGTSSNGAGAFGATINISTNNLIEKPYAEFNNSYGSFNTHKHTLKLGTGLIKDHFTVDARLSKIGSDGYIDRATSDLGSYYASAAYYDAHTQIRFNAFGGKEKTYQAWYGVPESMLKTNRTFNPAGTEKPGEPYENQTDNYWQKQYQLFFNHSFNESLALNVAFFLTKGKGYYEEYKADQHLMDYGINDPGNSDLVRQLWLDNDFYGNIFSLHYKKNGTQLTFGGGWNQYNGDHFGKVIWTQRPVALLGSEYYKLDALKTDLNIYGKWEQKITDRLSTFADLQFRKVKYDLNGFRNNPTLFISNNYEFINPKAGLSYRNENFRAYFSYALGRKEPNRDDFEAGLNQQPTPETLHDFELGFEKKTNKTTLAATLFYMKYKDQLVLTGKINDVGAYTRTNIPDSYRFGVELQASVQPFSKLRWDGNLSLSENKVLKFTDYVDDYDFGDQQSTYYAKSDIAFSPAVIASSTFTFLPTKNIEASLVSKYTGSQFLDNTGSNTKKLNAYFLNDLRLMWTMKAKFLKEINFFGQVNNIFDVKYEPAGYTFSYYYLLKLTTENYYYPMAGINFMVGLNLKL